MRALMLPSSVLRTACVLALCGSAVAAPLQVRRASIGRAPQLRPTNYLANLRLDATLQVGLNLLATANQTPYKSGEMQIPFSSQLTITTDQLRAPHLFVPFRWSSKLAKPVAAQWQVVQTPSSYEDVNWEYPAGIVARGTVRDLPKQPGNNSYFVVDFRPIYDLPKEYRLRPPAKKTLRGRRTRNSTAVRKFGIKPQARPLTPAQLSFAKQLDILGEHRSYYVRLVLLGAQQRPIAISTYVPIRSAPPTAVTIYPGSVPANNYPPQLNLPAVKIVAYEPPRYFSCSDSSHRFIVLSNCPKMLLDTMRWKVGQQVYIPPKRDEGIDSIGDAVGAAFDGIADLVNWVSQAWSDLQAAFVDGICGGNATCKSVAGPALQVGLMYVGIPPDLPNFNELCSMGKDYLATYVADQTGMPEDLVRKGIDKMADVVNNPPGGNGGTFLWPDPAYQDRPPRVDVEITNTSGKATDPSTLWLRYGSSQGDSATYPPHIPTWLDTQTPLPPLQPGESLRFPIFLTPNPETMISHGADRVTTYQGRRIRIYDVGGKLIYTGRTNWMGGTPDQ